MRIGIINYGLGNMGSVYSAFKFYRYQVSIINDARELKNIDILVLAGVGNFSTVVSRLKEKGFWDEIHNEVIAKKKLTFGICLGMQLFADVSYEAQESRGFGWIKGKVIKIEGTSLRVPHIGWNNVDSLDNKVFRGLRHNSFYFMHSYHFVPEDKSVIIATTKYGSLEIVSAVRKENIVGVQFHPEKSQGDGLRLLKNLVEVFA